MAKRRLTDLWVVGRELVLDDNEGDPVTLWLQKLNSVDAAETVRHADAARARHMTVRKDHDSDEYQSVVNAVNSYGEDIDRIVDYLLLDERVRVTRVRELEVSFREEWQKDNYLQGLQDAWSTDLLARWGEDPTDEEALRVKAELERFIAAITELVEEDLAVLRDVYEAEPIEDLRERLVDKLIESDANQAWLDEFYRSQIWLGSREIEDHSKRYFVSRSEVAELSTLAFRALRSAYESLEVDVSSGKSSPEAPASSGSSAQPVEEATADSSGLVAVGA